MGGGGGVECCAVCFGMPLLLTIIILIYLAFKSNYTPSCSLSDLYIPALDTRLPIFNSSAAATFIFFDLQLDNRIESDGVRYEFVNPTLAFYYARNPIANYTLPRFPQGDDKTAHLRDLVETRGMPWSDALEAVSGGSTAAFTVEFSATVKVKREVGHTGDKEVLLRADLEVNDSGEELQNKDIKLNSISNPLTSFRSV